MELDELSQSGIRRIADYSPYLDQLAGLAQEMGLRQRSNLVHLERCLHDHWSLGQNNLLSWAPLDEGILILVLPHYAIAEFTSSQSGTHPPRVSPVFITELISGNRQLNFQQMQKVSRLLDVKPVYVPLRQALSGHPVETQIIEKMIRRYGISYVASRAVTLFDIVGFSLLTPFEQMTQLNSLSYSLNSAHAKMLMTGWKPTSTCTISCTSCSPIMPLQEARRHRKPCLDCAPVSTLAVATSSTRLRA